MSTTNPVAACDFVVFGGTGDLAVRSFCPPFLRDRDGQLPAETRIIAASRAGLDVCGYRDKVRAELGRFVPEDAIDPQTLERFLARLDYASIDFADVDDWLSLTTLLPADPGKVRVFYLSTAPDCSAPSARGSAGTVWRRGARAWCWRSRSAATWPARARSTTRRRGLRGVADLPHRPLPGQGDGAEPAGAALRQRAVRAAVERRAHRPRADHRGRDRRRGAPRRLLRPRRRDARHGAEPHAAAAVPGGDGAAGCRSTPDAVRDEKLKVLRALRPIDGADVPTLTVRGQYRAGAIEGSAVPGYLEELGERGEPTPRPSWR